MSLYVSKAVLASIFALFSLWGFQINAIDSVSYFRHPLIFLALTVCFFILISVIDYLIERIESLKDITLSNPVIYISGFGVLLVWIVVWMAVFPGLAIYDGPSQLSQYKLGTISTHHPYIHSAFLGLCDRLSVLFGFEDYSFYNSLIQLIFQWFCYMRLLFTMKRLNCKWIYIVLTIAYMAFYPPNAFLALTTTKDTIFIGFFILLLCEIAIIYTDNHLSYATVIRIIVFGTMMSIFRNNGIYVFVAAFPFLLAIRPKINRRKWILMYCSVIILALCYSGFVSDILHIRSGDAREALSVIIQPLSRIYNSVPGQLSTDEIARIQKIFSGNDTIQYVSYCSDYSKFIFDTDYFFEHFGENIKLYFSLFFRYPSAYVDAWLATNLGNYYPLESLPRYYKVYYEIPLQDQGHSLIPGLYDIIANFAWNSSYRSSKLLTIWLNSGTSVWKLLYLVYYILKKKRLDKIALCMFPLMLYGTLLLAAGTVIRYSQPITMSIPLILGLALLKDRTDQ